MSCWCEWDLREKFDIIDDVKEIKDGLLYVRGDIEDIKLCMIKIMQILLGDKYNNEMKELFGEEGKNELNNFDKEISQRREEYQKIMEEKREREEKLNKKRKKQQEEFNKQQEEFNKQQEEFKKDQELFRTNKKEWMEQTMKKTKEFLKKEGYDFE